MLRLFTADAIQASNELRSQDKYISSTLAERSGTGVKIFQIKEGENTFKANSSCIYAKHFKMLQCFVNTRIF